MAYVDTGLHLQYGSFEEARAWIGSETPPRDCEDEIERSQIKYFCSLVEDGNPSYWDEEWARAHWGGILAPPGLLFVWSMPLLWRPGGEMRPPTIATQIPLPGDTVINVSTDSRFLRPVLAGDRLSFVERVIDVSAEKKTQLGAGHFITTEITYRNHRGEVVGVHRNVLFRYRSTPEEARP
ncbi:MAG: MaoC family dehydratase N-terminal domain-containing protein [Deltaproteobacteria bacterium]|nr:MaoC family dehydratase N-terminal domain-containing protein [Deltaproteobacteria bacterium]